MASKFLLLLLPSHRLASLVPKPLSAFHSLPARPRHRLLLRRAPSRGIFCTPAVGTDAVEEENEKLVKEEYPTGEFEMEEFDVWRRFGVKLKMLFALPWERVRKGSVLSMKLKGQVEKLKQEGWITNIMYDDEIISMLKERLGLQKDKKLSMVDFSKYSRVRNWTLGLAGSGDQIAIIRASGSISRTRSPLSSSSGVVSDQLIEKIRNVRESKRYKAAILQIDSPGGDALASDLMWREIRLLAASKPVIASMSDVAASGGYYMAMAAGAIVAENLTLTGSIGVVTGKFSLKNLYEKIGFNKEILSRGKYAELTAADQRPFRPHEAELFAKSAQNAYKLFRDKAAFSRSMTVDQMEEVAQGRVWSGTDAASRGLVDAIGGLSRAIAIAKQKANIPQDKQVRLVELSRPKPSLPALVTGIGGSLLGIDNRLNEILHDLASTQGIQARIDGILFERIQGSSGGAIVSLIKDILRSL